MNTIRTALVLISFLTVQSLICSSQVSIVVNKGPFHSVEEAALSEDRVNFRDEDQTDDRACTECFAATELANFLPLITPVKSEDIKFADIGTIPEEGIIFILGSMVSNPSINRFESPDEVHFDTEQSYSIRSFNENDKLVTIIEGADRIGTLYGVYHYLEDLGVKFIGPGEKGTVIENSPCDLPSDLNILENPSYLTRGFYTWGDRKVEDEFFYWMARNKFNYWTAENQPVKLLKKLGVKLSDGGHRIQGAVFASDSEYPYNHPVFKGDEDNPDDPYDAGDEYQGDADGDGKLSNYEAHPEWYGMKNGQRMKIVYSSNAAQSGTNFCTSNDDARKEFAKRIVKQLIHGIWENIDVFEFWFFDGGSDLWCDCDKCRIGGSFTDKMFIVTYDILNELKIARQEGKLTRRIEVSNIAYHATLDPPSKPLPADYDYQNSSLTYFPIRRCYVHSFADPACREINQWQLKAYQGWTTGDNRYYKGSMFIGEYYNVSNIKSLPVVFTKIMATDIPWYHQTGARSFNYMHTPHKLWGTWTLNQHLLGKLLWNVNTDANAIILDYFRNYYPTTGSTTKKFYENLEIASANIKALRHVVALSRGTNYTGINYSLRGRLLKGDLFELEHMKYNKYQPLTDDGPDVVEMMDAIESAKKYLEQSLIDCRDSTELNRLLEDEIRFEYGYATYRYLFHMIRTSVFHKEKNSKMAAREFAIAEEYAEKLKEMVEVVQVSSDHANAANGFDATASESVFNEFKRLYGK